jgi:hypothetical protein
MASILEGDEILAAVVVGIPKVAEVIGGRCPSRPVPGIGYAAKLFGDGTGASYEAGNARFETTKHFQITKTSC